MIWILLVVFQLKHFIADYPLQNAYMLGKFKDKGWVLPLAAHSGVHFLMTSAIALVCGLGHMSFVIGAIDFCIHFVMDRIKASPNMLGRFESLSKKEMQTQIIPALTKLSGDKIMAEQRLKSNTYFWWSLGLDQMVHHLTDILMVYFIYSLWSAL